MIMAGDKAEIAFFDVETTVPTRAGQGHAILEFGAILVCPRKLIELENYSTLVRPLDLALISSLSVRCNGITKDAVVSAPSFAEIADKVYDILHGRIWAGHNILRFDCPRIREAFAEINRPPPEPKGTLDSLALLTQKFGRRAGDMKMASLATYFGLGQQTHRSLDDVRMNLEVLKYCATVLFLESSLPDVFTENSWISPNAITRSRTNGQTSRQGSDSNPNTPSPSSKNKNSLVPSPANNMLEESHPILQLVMPSTSEEVSNQAESNSTRPDPFEMGALSDEVGREPILSDDNMLEDTSDSSFQETSDSSFQETSDSSFQESSTESTSEGTITGIDFLEPDEVSIPSISVIQAPFFRGTQKIQILHDHVPLQLRCRRLKVRFGVSTKFVDFASRPRLTFVVDASPTVCGLLENIDVLACNLSKDSGSNAEWRPIVIRKPGFYNSPTLRLHLPTILDGGIIRWVTDIYKEESSTQSSMQRIAFSRYDATELESLLASGTFVDAYFSLDAYDYQQNAGVRLVAKKLIIHSN